MAASVHRRCKYYNLTEIDREKAGFSLILLLKTDCCYGILFTYGISRQSLGGGSHL